MQLERDSYSSPSTTESTSHDDLPESRLLPIINIEGSLSTGFVLIVMDAVLLTQAVTEDRNLTE